MSLTLSASDVTNEKLCCPRVRYNGFYLGSTIGYGQYYIKLKNLKVASTSFSFEDSRKENVCFDVQLGYDWQCGDKVIGLVLDTESFRTRGGIQYGNHLVFATAGVAFKILTYTINDGFSFLGKDYNKIGWGWICGLGTESPLWRNFTIGANLFYTYLPEKRMSGSLRSGNHYSFKSSGSLWSAEVSFNYRFGDFRCCR